MLSGVYRAILDKKDLQGHYGLLYTRWPLIIGMISSIMALIISGCRTTKSKSLDSFYAICSEEPDKIYTVDSAQSQTQCIVVQGSYIIDTGSLDSIQTQWHKKGNKINLLSWTRAKLPIKFIQPGSIIVPGLSDSHAHILEYGATQQLALGGAKSVQEAVALVREYIVSTPEIYNNTSHTVIGGGWDHTVWGVGGWPTSDDLDADNIIRGRPVILQSKDCHALWVSSKAIEESVPFPESVEGGYIFRDDRGRPTVREGVLLDNAQDLLKQPELTEANLLLRFQTTVRHALSFGLTSIHDAGLDPVSLAFFKRQAEIATLPLRIYGMTYFDETKPYWGNVTKPLVDDGSRRLTARSIKIFADGALRTGGSALHEPYADNPTTKGFMRIGPDTLYDVIPRFLRDGWQVNIHAIGDRANGIVLDVFEESLKGINVTASRPRLEHAQMMSETDMSRLSKIGVIASVQPTHAISDMWYAQERLGAERVKSLYAFRSIVDSGAKITLGSDAPVESLNPLATFYAAITRTSWTGESPHGPDGWFPEQRLSRWEALKGMTIDPAYASFTEDTLGSLEIGKRADFTVLSQDIMEIPVQDILATTVHASAIDGEIVYGAI